jgi:hypothetical protein
MTEVQQLEATVALGLQVEGFLSGPIGAYLVGKAEEEIEAALQELKTVTPTDVPRIVTLQNVIHRAESVQYWLAEAVQEGLNAQQELVTG